MKAMKAMKAIQWDQGVWLNPPLETAHNGAYLQVDTVHESDFWRNTSYGFVHDSGHALLTDFPENSSMEVSFILDYSGQFDQAGIIVYSDSQRWIKAGVESADGFPQVGAVVTSVNSDWSLAPVPQWMGREVTVRASRTTDALTIRARCGQDDQLIRLAPMDATLSWSAGPHCASPTSQSLMVTFTHWAQGEADIALH
jgi:regulation of enolase protein 1 (concanavalin A-like superfamily)